MDSLRETVAKAMHECHLDDMIERLQELKTKAVEHFGSKWEGKN